MIIKGKKGNLFFGLAVAFLILMTGFMVVQLINPDLNTTLGVNGLDCDNPAVSDGTKITCLLFYLLNPYFLALIVLVCIGLIVKKFI